MSKKTVDILNAIRNSSESEYYIDRIPPATTENMKEIGRLILTNANIYNIFLENLYNKIGRIIFSNKTYTNRLKTFKRDSMEYGNFIQEIFVDLVDGKDFDFTDDDSHPFRREKPNVYQDMHKINSQKVYKTTVSREMMARAFESEDGLFALISAIIQKLYDSYELDEFTQTKMLLVNAIKNGLVYEVNIPEMNEQNAKHIARIIKEYSDKLTYMNTAFNANGVSTHTPKENQYLITSSKFDAYMDVEVLASAFNMDKVEFYGHRVQIDNFLDLIGVEAMLIDKDFLIIVDNLIQTEHLYNPEKLYTNYWLHVHQIFSVSKFNNAIVFRTVQEETVPEFDPPVLKPWSEQHWEEWKDGNLTLPLEYPLQYMPLKIDFPEVDGETYDCDAFTCYYGYYDDERNIHVGYWKEILVKKDNETELLGEYILKTNETGATPVAVDVINNLDAGTYKLYATLVYYNEDGERVVTKKSNELDLVITSEEVSP